MTNFADKKLQIFVSSTYKDLVPERRSAFLAILTAGHIPVGMENFIPNNLSPLKTAYEKIDESDIYFLILGGRYGDIEPHTGKSYTHLEYEYALEKEKIMFACVIHEEILKKRIGIKQVSVMESANLQKLIDFRKLVMSKMIDLWEDEKDIQITVLKKLSNITKNNGDLIGWTRGKKIK